MLFSTISACSNISDPAPASKSSLVIPTPLQKLAVNDDELNAYVVIDGDENNRILMILNRSGQGLASVDIPSLSREAHSFVVTYEFTNANGAIILATSNQVVNLTSGSTSITVSADEYDLDIYDEDGDGINNAQELLIDRDPFIPEVDMTISTSIPEFNATATGTLRAIVVLDNNTENPIEMDINAVTGTASFTFDALFKTPHDIVVTFEYTDNTGKLTLARANRSIDLTNGAVEIDIDVNSNDFAKLDDDKDGVNNAAELIAGLNPRIPKAPATPAVAALTYEPTKAFLFTWQDVPDATYYQLQERIDTDDKLVVISDKILPGQTFKHIVPLYARLNAEYILQSCNAVGCVSGEIIPVEPTSFFNSIGKLTLTTAAPANRLDFSVSLSSDGKTLAASTGLDSPTSIVAIIFTFVNKQWEQQSTIILDNIKSANAENKSNNIPIVTLSQDGNTLVLASPGDDSGLVGVPADTSQIDSGAVYVYSRNENNWIQQAYLKASNIGAGDQFGNSIDLSADGNTLVIGSPFEDSNARGINGIQNNDLSPDSGATYVFNRNDTSWTQQSYIKASNADINYQFGSSVALSGDGKTFVAGATEEDGINNTLLEAGAAYVFVLDSLNNWGEQQVLKPTTTRAGERFGNKLDLSFNGNTLSEGIIHIFNRNENQIWGQEFIPIPNGFLGDASLDDSGSILMIGFPFDLGNIGDLGSNGESTTAGGSILSFVFDGSEWIQQARMTGGIGSVFNLSGDGKTLVTGGRLTLRLF